jgi:hypothetical protein
VISPDNGSDARQAVSRLLHGAGRAQRHDGHQPAGSRQKRQQNAMQRTGDVSVAQKQPVCEHGTPAHPADGEQAESNPEFAPGRATLISVTGHPLACNPGTHGTDLKEVFETGCRARVADHCRASFFET